MKKKRPYVVAEFVYSMNYHGRLWTVGCLTEDAAHRSLQRRVAKNMARHGSPGAVIAFERYTRRPIAWTGEVRNPKGALDYFVRGG